MIELKEAPSSKKPAYGTDSAGLVTKVLGKTLFPMSKEIKVFSDILKGADIAVNGKHPWDIEVRNEEFYRAALADGSLGVGESYMKGWWDSARLDETVYRAAIGGIYQQINPVVLFQVFLSKAINQQSKARSKRVAQLHYDLGNDLYEKMLDPRMQYTCAYWKNASSLEEAQQNKLDLVCKKIQLKPGDKVLELGCGWGGFAKFAAEKYGAVVTAYNISVEQVDWARKNCEGLPVTFRLQDYREATGTFDKIVSIGLCEHIGHKNYRGLMTLAHQCLKDNGIFLLHSIGRNHTATTQDPWLDKYIFPGSVLPSPKQLTSASDGIFVLEDWHNFGVDYDKTLMAWWENFDRRWPEIKSPKYDDTFYRMWKYYLLMCAGSFRARKNQLWQLVYSKGGVPGGYEPVR